MHLYDCHQYILQASNHGQQNKYLLNVHFSSLCLIFDKLIAVFEMCF